MPVVWSDRHRSHDPGGEVWVGVRMPGTELPARAERIRERLEASGARIVHAGRSPTSASRACTTPTLVELPRERLGRLGGGRAAEDPGQDRVVPYLFPHPGLFADGRAPAPRGRDHGARRASSPTTR